ncbi:uncharacterized protein LOC111366652 [Olea europaea var. sylvestris]|uniref:uncharacterized protein LOC111366652 n=1 Tax=Olea europaea var. sylvestris TaxID=158386 RepID=UPI000C1CD6CE|nr:uncharacterized protein LOC111366652 [Olea europaea var. sylvestris]
MQQLNTINKKIRGYLDEIGPERLHMPTNRYSTMTSNIVKSVNAVTKAVKNYPIIALLDSLRQTTQSWFCKNKDTAYGTFTKLSTKYEKMMREMSTSLRNMRVSPANQTIFSVADDGSSFVIDIEKRTCTCRMLQVNKMPCPHALAVIATTKRDPYDYCSYFYTSEAYMNAYQYIVYPIESPNEWIVTPKVEDVIVLAPNQKRRSGRPAEKRRRSCIEGKQMVKCGRCEGSGHNHRTCNNLLQLVKK